MNLRAATIIRLALAFLFLWFGIQQLVHASDWVAFLPAWTGYFPIPSEMLVRWNGWFEVVFGILLAIGFLTRFTAALLGLHLLGIALSVGGALGVRDGVLAIVTLALAFTPADAYCLDQHPKFTKVPHTKK